MKRLATALLIGGGLYTMIVPFPQDHAPPVTAASSTPAPPATFVVGDSAASAPGDQADGQASEEAAVVSPPAEVAFASPASYPAGGEFVPLVPSRSTSVAYVVGRGGCGPGGCGQQQTAYTYSYPQQQTKQVQQYSSRRVFGGRGIPVLRRLRRG